MSEYYDHTTFPSYRSSGSSASLRAEFDKIEAGFDKLPIMAGNANKLVVVNSGGTALTVTAGTISLAGPLIKSGAHSLTLQTTGTASITLPTTGTLSTSAGTETFTNKTIVSPIVSGVLDLQGGQIKFAATQVSSSDVNTLDDYEEGGWTPSVGGTATYVSRAGLYTKIGRMVFIQAVFQISVIGTGSVSTISGLPFTVQNDNAGIAFGTFSSLATAVGSLHGVCASGTTTIVLSGSTASPSTSSNSTSTIMGSNTAITLTGSYMAAT